MIKIIRNLILGEFGLYQAPKHSGNPPRLENQESTNVKYHRLPWWGWVLWLIILQVLSWISIKQLYVSRLADLYLPFAFSIALIYWHGPKTLILVFINALLNEPLWGHKDVMSWPIFALAETLFPVLSWALFIRAFKGDFLFPSYRDVIQFIVLGIMLPLVIEIYIIRQALVFIYNHDGSNMLEWVVRATLGDSMQVISLSFVLLHFGSRVFRISGVHSYSEFDPTIEGVKPVGQLIREYILFCIGLVVGNLFLNSNYWFLYGLFGLIVAAFRGFSAAIIVNFSIMVATYFVPVIFYSDGLGHNELAYIFFGNTLFAVFSITTGRIVTDLRNSQKTIELQMIELKESHVEQEASQQKIIELQKNREEILQSRLVEMKEAERKIMEERERLLKALIDQQTAEETLRENEELLRAISDNYPDSYLSVIEKDFTIGYTSGYEFKKRGLDTHQYVGLKVEQIFNDKTEFVEAYFRNAFKGIEGSFELFHEDQYLLFRVMPLVSPDGSVPRILSVAKNITDRKLNEESLKKSEELMKQAEKLGRLGHYAFDTADKGNPIWSVVLRELWGFPGDLPLQWDMFIQRIHPEDVEIVKAEIAEASSKPYRFSCDFRIIHPDNKILTLQTIGESNYHHVTGKLRIVGVFIDVTLRKEMEQLTISHQAAKEATLVKDQFLSIMSHEIRTPLNSVIGLSNLLMSRGLKEDQKDVVKILKSSADNLMHLVNDILDFNKINSKHMSLEILPIDIHDLLRQQYLSNQMLAQDRGIDFTFQIDPSIPQQIEGDSTRLNQIFLNLISNAIKFTPTGYVKLEAHCVSQNVQECLIRFRVEDSGIGIPQDKMDSIFDPFHQSGADISRKFGGTGLGLSIVKSLVKLMWGQIIVTSEPARGSIFEIEIPFAIPSAPARDIMLSSDIILSDMFNQSKMGTTVLYVEDVTSNQFLIENLLEDNQINCVTVSNGSEALQQTRSRIFDVILMDIQMPDMDGYQTTDIIRKQVDGVNHKTPIIAFTAEPYSPALRRKTLEHDMQYIISKPFDHKILLEKIRLFASVNLPHEQLFSFHFYEKALNYDEQKIRKMKKAIIGDLMRFELKIKQYGLKVNDSELHSEIHRIRPILKNLACDELATLADQFKLYAEHDEKIDELKDRIRAVAAQIIAELREQNVTAEE